jgi:hypothetical protein
VPKADIDRTCGLTGDGRRRSGQDDPDFRELARLRIDLNRSAMLLDDDVVTDGQAKSSPFSGRLGREERIEDLLLHLGWNAGAVVADPDLHAVAEVLYRRNRYRAIAGLFSACALRPMPRDGAIIFGDLAQKKSGGGPRSQRC